MASSCCWRLARAAARRSSTQPREAERTLPFYDSADFTPKWDGVDAPTAHRIRPFRLTDQQNAPFTEADLGGRIAVVDFFFTTCPAICPLMAASMGDVQKAFLDDDRVVLLSHSVTPETDTPEVLAQYADGPRRGRRQVEVADRTQARDLRPGPALLLRR